MPSSGKITPQGPAQAVWRHVVVVSHMRSGTHLTIDNIGNNFATYRKLYAERGYVILDNMLKRSHEPVAPEQIRAELALGPRIVLTHSHFPIDRFFEESRETAAIAAALFAQAHIVHVRRSPPDVLWSLYHFQSVWNPAVLQIPFSDYIRQRNQFNSGVTDRPMDRPEYLAFHTRGWLGDPRALSLRFEDLAHQHRRVSAAIASHLREAPARRLHNMYWSGWERSLFRLGHWPLVGWLFIRVYWRVSKGVDRRSIAYWRGKMGEGVRQCSVDDLRFISDRMGDNFYLPPSRWARKMDTRVAQFSG